MENNSGCLRREGVFINLFVCDKRCALRNLFGLAISPQTPPDPPNLARRAALISLFRLM